MQTNRPFEIPQWAYALIMVVVLAGAALLPRNLTGPAFLLLTGGGLSVGASVGVRRWVAWASPRDRLHSALRWVSLIFAVGSGLLLDPAIGETTWPLALLLALLASALAAPALTLTPLPPTPDLPCAYAHTWHWIALAVSVPILLLLGFLSTDRYGENVIWPDAHTQFAMLWIAVGGVVIGLGAVTRFPSCPRLPYTAWVVLALTIVGFGLRLLRLGSHLEYMPDEWIFASAISRFNPTVAITEPVGIYAASTWVFVYWQHALSALVNGGLFGLRVTSAVIGALTVAATGWLASELFDQRPTTHRAVLPFAVMTAVVLAFFPSHIHFSRLALYNIVDPLVGVVAGAFLARAFRTGERTSYVLAGATLGLSQYFYEAGRLLFIPLFGLWMFAAFLQDRARWRSLLLATVAAVIIGILPWFPSLFDNETGVLRLRTGSFLYDEDTNPITSFALNIDNALLMLTTTPDDPAVPYYGGSEGLVPLMWLPFFVVGGVLLLTRPLRLNHLLPLLWIGGMIAGAALLRDQSTPRFAIVLPMLALVSAFGLNAVVAQISRRNRLSRLALVTVLGAFALSGTVHYFVQHIPHMNREWKLLSYRAGGYSWEDLAFRMTDVPDANYVVIIADRHSLAVEGRIFREMLNYFNPTVRPIQYRPTDDLEAELWLLSGTDDITFFIQPTDAETLRLVERYFVLSDPYLSELFPEGDVGLVRFDVLRLVNEQRPEFPGSDG